MSRAPVCSTSVHGAFDVSSLSAQLDREPIVTAKIDQFQTAPRHRPTSANARRAVGNFVDHDVDVRVRRCRAAPVARSQPRSPPFDKFPAENSQTLARDLTRDGSSANRAASLATDT
jgi:hypothetical protein